MAPLKVRQDDNTGRDHDADLRKISPPTVRDRRCRVPWRRSRSARGLDQRTFARPYRAPRRDLVGAFLISPGVCARHRAEGGRRPRRRRLFGRRPSCLQQRQGGHSVCRAPMGRAPTSGHGYWRCSTRSDEASGGGCPAERGDGAGPATPAPCHSPGRLRTAEAQLDQGGAQAPRVAEDPVLAEQQDGGSGPEHQPQPTALRLADEHGAVEIGVHR